jgi:hypothetical protein
VIGWHEEVRTVGFSKQWKDNGTFWILINGSRLDGMENRVGFSKQWKGRSLDRQTGWHGGQWDFQNNEKTMEHCDHWITIGWHGEPSRIFKTMKRQITGSWLDGMEDSGIFKTMKRQCQWNIAIIGSWLDVTIRLSIC